MSSSLLSAKARGIAPYVAGEQPRGEFVKLNTNENPYPPSPAASKTAAAFDFARLRKYPDPEATILREAIAAKYGLGIDNIVCGNGSDEILALCFQAFFPQCTMYNVQCTNESQSVIARSRSDEAIQNNKMSLRGEPFVEPPQSQPIYFPDVTYSFYKVWCQSFGIDYVCPPVDGNFEINLKDYTDKIPLRGGVDAERTGWSKETKRAGIVIANPNAPTGIAISVKDIEKILKANPGTAVIVDEAYSAFSGQTCLPLIKKYKNLCVVQTFSKSYSLAGLRVGFAAADAALIDGVRRMRDSFNSYPLDSFAAAIAAAAFKDEAYLKETSSKVVATREKFAAALRALDFRVLPSGANFVFARHPSLKGDFLAAALREKGILVRRFAAPRIEDWLRITIGTDADMDCVVKALKEIIGLTCHCEPNL